ncbi:hypothetical protein MM300_15125 [Evansella sp. LMS18]|uniref:hypothetical protein n=1 Tax=Evansella sp. LMS18 TaxID=2924033 RepID=UPI0020D04C0F|nr:hypothetical protein [Evansella sp. LMS18]UTR09226.1 hypothetical protein MM300_15125 [Evansella sp. LMS18]
MNNNKPLAQWTYGEFQEHLVQHVMNHLEKNEITSPLIYFPLVNEKVETFLFAHWQEAWDQCSHLTWEEWRSDNCYKIFEDEVINDTLKEVQLMDMRGPEPVEERELI